MKAIISGRDFSKASANALIYADQFEAFCKGQIVIHHDEVTNHDAIEYPVLVIPETAKFKPIRHILYATNFYEADEAVVRQLAYLGRIFEASIHCVHIDTDEAYTSWTNVLADRFSNIAADLDVTFTNVCSDSVVEGLELFIKNNRIDFMAMLLHQHKTPVDTQRDLIKVMAHQNNLPLMLFPETVFHDQA